MAGEQLGQNREGGQEGQGQEQSCCPLGTLRLPPGFSGLPPGVPAHAVLRGSQLLLAPGGRCVPVHTAGPLGLLGAAHLQALPDHRLG